MSAVLNEALVRSFLTLARTRNVTEAARQLYMSQQGVSKHIAKVEEEMGFPLFIRSHRSVSLTAEGERCYEIFSHFMEEYEDFLAGARSGHSRQVKTLRVGYQNWLDFGPAPGRALEALREVVPELELTGERHSPCALRQPGIGTRLPVGNFKQAAPNLLLERCSLQQERKRKRSLRTVEIGMKPAHRPLRQLRFLLRQIGRRLSQAQNRQCAFSLSQPRFPKWSGKAPHAFQRFPPPHS